MIIAATGHRPDKLGGYGAAVEDRLRAHARRFLAQHPGAWAISGMALGWDMAWAEAALGLGLQVLAAVPFAGQESRWPPASQRRYNDILGRSMVCVICEGGYAAWKMQRRNEWMVDSADLVAALWDGSAGGTGNCVAYAEKRKRPVVNLWPAT